MKPLLTLLILIIICTGLFAQKITKQEKGYFNLTELGYHAAGSIVKETIFGGNEDPSNPGWGISVKNINGIFVNNNLSLGIGIGLDSYGFKNGNSDAYPGFTTLPIFGDLRYYLKNKANTFFAYGDLGSSVAISDGFSRGLLYNIGIGYKFKVIPHLGMTASACYNFQAINDNYSPDRQIRSLILKLGILL